MRGSPPFCAGKYARKLQFGNACASASQCAPPDCASVSQSPPGAWPWRAAVMVRSTSRRLGASNFCASGPESDSRNATSRATCDRKAPLAGVWPFATNASSATALAAARCSRFRPGMPPSESRAEARARSESSAEDGSKGGCAGGAALLRNRRKSEDRSMGGCCAGTAGGGGAEAPKDAINSSGARASKGA